MVIACRRITAPLAMLAILAPAVAACSGGGSPDDGGDAGQAAPIGTGYTSDQLRQALPTELAGYQRAGEPDAGEYASLTASQNYAQLQRQITLDKPKCSSTSRISGLDAAPSALAVFVKPSGQSVSTMLMGVTGPTAEQQLRVRVPAGCRSFRSKVGDQWSTHEVIEAGGQNTGSLGLGSRTVGITTVTGNTAVRTWYVLLRGRGYLGTITLYGPNVTRTEAEQLAKTTYQHAERILP